MLYACGPEGMLAACARLAARFGRPCQVSVERVMGCGMGGCYSCVVPMRADDGRFHHVRSCLAGPVLAGRSDHLGLDARDMDLSVRIGSLDAEEPADRRQRLLRLRRRVRRPGRPLHARRRRRQGTVPRPSAKAIPPPRIVETPAGMLNAIGLQGIGVRRFVDEKLPELRARGATVDRERVRHDARRIRRGLEDPVGRRRRRTPSS